jgi:mannose-6-phosphate isomerase-like protein (cupin superfamily)
VSSIDAGSGILFRAEQDAEYYFEEGCHILELCNDPADPQLSIARARIPAGGHTRRHRLEGITERYLILEGSGTIQIGALEESVVPGDVVLIPAGETQAIRNTGTGELIFLALCTPRFRRSSYAEVAATEQGAR